MRAAGRGDIEQVGLLLDIGINPHTLNDAGTTALHQAAWRGQLEMVRLLVSRGASATATDELDRETPYEWALHGAEHAQGAKRQSVEVAAWLAAGPFKCTPCHKPSLLPLHDWKHGAKRERL